MEENRKGLGSAPPPKPLPSVLLKQAEALSDPSSCLSQDWLPQAQVPLEVKVGGSGQTQTSFGESLRPLLLFCISVTTSAEYPGSGQKGDQVSGSA